MSDEDFFVSVLPLLLLFVAAKRGMWSSESCPNSLKVSELQNLTDNQKKMIEQQEKAIEDLSKSVGEFQQVFLKH